jgi:outer membrane lipoprotein-sorting protein
MKLTAALTLLLLSACTPRAPVVDDASIEVRQALADRATALRDFSVEGEITQGAVTKRFTFDLKQPRLMRARSLDDGQTVTFDGKQLTIQNDVEKTAFVQDLSTQPEAMVAAVLYAAFQQFLCEGWRAPLLRPGHVQIARASADAWRITNAIDDDTLKEDRVTLRAPRGDFISRESVDKQDRPVLSVRVLEEHHDAATHLTFPKVWELVSGPTTRRTKLSSIRINEGLTSTIFDAQVPAGYAIKNPGTAP